MKIKNIFCPFFKCSFNFRAHALQSESNKVSISNFLKFSLQSISSKIEQAFEKRTKFFKEIGPKSTLFMQIKGP